VRDWSAARFRRASALDGLALAALVLVVIVVFLDEPHLLPRTSEALNLSPVVLPLYAAYSLLRMLAAYALSPGLRLRMRGLGRAVARGALAVELSHGSVAPDMERLVGALRRLGLSMTDVPSLARAVRADHILLLAAVPREEALGWGRLLQAAGAVSLTARPGLRRWPPAATVAAGRRLGTPRRAPRCGAPGAFAVSPTRARGGTGRLPDGCRGRRWLVTRDWLGTTVVGGSQPGLAAGYSSRSRKRQLSPSSAVALAVRVKSAGKESVGDEVQQRSK
jgi:hypothetical protein